MRTAAGKMLLLVMVLTFSHGLPAAAAAQSAVARGADNRVLLAASSPFEDLTEFAIAGDSKGIQRALHAYEAQAGAVQQALPGSSRDQLQALVAQIKRAAGQGDYGVIALKSPEAYRTLIEALDSSTLKVPREVSLLDYAGFRVLAVVHAKPGDWSALLATANDAQKNWDAIKARVTDQGLHEAMDVTLAGLIKSCTKKIPIWHASRRKWIWRRSISWKPFSLPVDTAWRAQPGASAASGVVRNAPTALNRTARWTSPLREHMLSVYLLPFHGGYQA